MRPVHADGRQDAYTGAYAPAHRVRAEGRVQRGVLLMPGVAHMHHLERYTRRARERQRAWLRAGRSPEDSTVSVPTSIVRP